MKKLLIAISLVFLSGVIFWAGSGVSQAQSLDIDPLGTGGLGADVTDESELDPTIRPSDFSIRFVDRNNIELSVVNPSRGIILGDSNRKLEDVYPGVITLTDVDTDSQFQYVNSQFGLIIDEIPGSVVGSACRVSDACLANATTSSIEFELTLQFDDTGFSENFAYRYDNSSNEGRWTRVTAFFDGTNGEGLKYSNSDIVDAENFNRSLEIVTGSSMPQIVSTEPGDKKKVYQACTDLDSAPSIFALNGTCADPDETLEFNLSANNIVEATSFITGTINRGGNSAPTTVAGGASPSTAGGTINGGSGISVASCETEFESLIDFAWIGCGALRTGDAGLRTFDDTIGGLLKVESEEYSNAGYRTAWSNIRYLATISVVMTAMFMVISTALDFGFFSNYTVKKYIPRLVIGTIAIQLSWVLAGLMSDFVNELGDGIELLLSSPFGVSEIADFNLRQVFGASSVNFGFAEVGGRNAAEAAAVGAGIVAAKSLGLFGSIALLYSGLVFLLVSYIFLVLRQIVIIAMIVLSPIGVALWILPGSDNAWNAYKKTFIALLMLYPIYLTMITIGKIFAFIAIGGATGTSISVTVFVIGFISYIGGYASGPFLARRSLGALQALTGTVNDRSKGIFDRGRNAIGERGKKRKEYRNAVRGEKRNRAGIEGYKVPGSDRRIKTTSSIARARMRADNGVPIVGLNKDTRERSALEQAANAQKLQKEAQERANFKVAASVEGMSHGKATSELSDLALDDSSEEVRQAAITQLAKRKDYKKLANIQASYAKSGRGGEWTKAIGTNFSDFKEMGAGLNTEVIKKDGSVKTKVELQHERTIEIMKQSDEIIANSSKDALIEARDSGELTPQRAGAIVNNVKIRQGMSTENIEEMVKAAGPYYTPPPPPPGATPTTP